MDNVWVLDLYAGRVLLLTNRVFFLGGGGGGGEMTKHDEQYWVFLLIRS